MRVEEIANNRYDAGLVSYLDVVFAQQTPLESTDLNPPAGSVHHINRYLDSSAWRELVQLTVKPGWDSQPVCSGL